MATLGVSLCVTRSTGFYDNQQLEQGWWAEERPCLECVRININTHRHSPCDFRVIRHQTCDLISWSCKCTSADNFDLRHDTKRLQTRLPTSPETGANGRSVKLRSYRTWQRLQLSCWRSSFDAGCSHWKPLKGSSQRHCISLFQS